MATQVILQATEHTIKNDKQSIAITSLAMHGDTIWCGLTAGDKALVPFSIADKTFGEAVSIFPWVPKRSQTVLSKIHNAMNVLEDDRVVLGEGILFTWDGIPVDFSIDPGAENQGKRRASCGLEPLSREEMGVHDMGSFDLREMYSGKVLIYDPKDGSVSKVGPLPLLANFVQSMTVDVKRKMAYGHTLGDCHFFVADLEKNTIEDHGRISTFSFHNLVVSPSGIVYGAWSDFGDWDYNSALRVLHYDPAKGFLERLPHVLLEEAGPRVQGNRGIDQWLVHSSGRIFVGSAGKGTLYEFIEDSLSLRECGRIGTGGRITSLDEDEKGRIIFSGGFPVMSVGRFDPKTNTIEDFGPVTDKYEHIYFHGSAYKDGTLYLAETDSGVASLWEVEMPD